MRIRAVIGWLGLVFLVTACGGGGGNGGGGGSNLAAPAISYGPSGSNMTQFTLVAQSAVSLTPNNTGGAVSTWSMSPALPAGLEFNSSTGAITGTPGSFAPMSVMVTASNPAGSSEVTLSLRSDSVVLNMGAGYLGSDANNFAPGAIALTSTNLLTQDSGADEQHWVLWNYSTGAILAQGIGCDQACLSQYPSGLGLQPAMAGQIAVVPYPSTGASGAPGPPGFQIVSTTTGNIAATVVPSGGVTWYQVASDGSYVCGASSGNGNLIIWGPDGSVITSRTGNYNSAKAYCAPGEVLVGNGPAGSNVIETISVPGGTSAVSAGFAGTFNSWFSDGSAFLSNVSTNVYVYSPTATQLDFGALPSTGNLGGRGSWFWTDDGTTLYIYKVGASATPTATYPLTQYGFQASGSTIAILGTPFSIIDLSGAAPSETSYSLPANFPSVIYAAVSASQWVLGGPPVLDGASLATTPRYFGYGTMVAIAGSQSRFAVATSLGKIFVYNASDLSLETTLDIPAQQLSMSSDGSVLAILTEQPGNNSVQTVSLPSGATINTWAYGSGPPAAEGITLSASGALLAQVLYNGASNPPSRQVTSSSGGPVLWSDTGSSSPVLLSLDDTLIAASGSTGTIIYTNDVETAAISGTGVGWLEGDDLLVNASNAGEVFNSSGIKVSAPALPQLNGPIQPLSATSIYDAGSNSIYSLSTGEKTWSPPSDATVPGAVAGTLVVFPNFLNQIVAEPSG